ncbi:dihydrolipoyl dehydrogenase [Thermotoga profunda]|uniref:dihydrolipoyl dehydrogenase n=1 Tax=Thermotoga profunda TaxID=1508420 RepID=UPI0005971A23|nr:dihydrolipoyl dehydrogenase [Thermotoga profunda]
MYDAVIIGAGPGGYVAAIKLSQKGKKVALVEKSFVGGTCTNWGCIPTKALLSSTHLYLEITEKSKQLGVNVENVQYDFSTMKNHMNKVVTMSRKGIEYLLKKYNVELINGEATIESPNLVKVADTKLEAKNIVIATGSYPALIPPFDKVPNIWTSDDVFKMEKLPESILIVGGGVIGVEFATFFSTLKVPVTIVELMEHILPTEDKDVAEIIAKSLRKKEVQIYESSKVIDVQATDEGFKCLIETKEGTIEKTVQKVLVSVGRRPKIGEDVKKLGIEIQRGIKTNQKMQTNIPNIYAIGDVRGQIMLAHVAMYEGVVAAKNICGEEAYMDYSAVPSVIFSNPEVASVGIREKDADPSKVKIFSFPLSANGRARTILEREGFVKVIAEKETKKILGMTIVGPSATDMIMEGVIAIKNGLNAKELEESIHPHPTLTETILGAMEGIVEMPIHL